MEQSEYDRREAMDRYAEALQRISVPLVHPYDRMPTCEKCGHSLRSMGYLFGLVMVAKGASSQVYNFCAGDLNSTANIEIHTPFSEAPKQITLPITCFGVFVPHLHLKCGRCGYHWLMATKDAKR